MATPKVFVSSTCYDLQEERTQLERFIISYGFQAILSEYSGVYYDVDAHTHESCVNEIEHCDMLILIISGRYGGKFKGGNGESITQAEYNKARELELPIFTFVKSEVSAAQHYYKENIRVHDEVFAKKINYPAIPKQTDAVSIFSFIDMVHRASTNNGIETYQSFSDIEVHLKKQWAGMFFSFLQKRKEQDKVEVMTSILDKLAGSSSKLEVLVGSLHDKEVGKDETSKLLEESKNINNAIQFYSILLRALNKSAWSIAEADERDKFIQNSTTEYPSVSTKGNLSDYLNTLPGLTFISDESSVNRTNEHIIGFTSYSTFGSFDSFTWVKMLSLYDNTIRNLDKKTLQMSFDTALEKYLW